MDPNLNWYFGHLNPQFNPGVCVALLTLLTYPVSTSPAKFNFSIMKRLKTALWCTMTETELLQFWTTQAQGH